ncbi:MAG: type II toxin-antitoxin system RelE/ParE family toxin [Planctomycetales bacterium]
MSFRVVFSARAERDAEEIRRWIASRSPEGAGKWVDALNGALARLESSADTCGLAPEDEGFDDAIQEVLFKTRRGNTYRVLFTMAGDVVRVLAIRGTGQNLLGSNEL